jgi:uncharacterized protein (DUF1778 family)
VDSRGFGREIDFLPNDEDADIKSLASTSPIGGSRTSGAGAPAPWCLAVRSVTTLDVLPFTPRTLPRSIGVSLALGTEVAAPPSDAGAAAHRTSWSEASGGEALLSLVPLTCNPVRCPYTVGVRTQRLELRLTDEERSIDQAAAAAVGESLSDFFRRAAANRAADVLADQRRISLTEDEATRFLEALETVDDHTVARLADLRGRT